MHVRCLIKCFNFIRMQCYDLFFSMYLAIFGHLQREISFLISMSLCCMLNSHGSHKLMLNVYLKEVQEQLFDFGYLYLVVDQVVLSVQLTWQLHVLLNRFVLLNTTINPKCLGFRINGFVFLSFPLIIFNSQWH